MYDFLLGMALLLSVAVLVLTNVELSPFSVFTLASCLACLRFTIITGLGVCIGYLSEVGVVLLRMQTFLDESISSKRKTDLVQPCFPVDEPSTFEKNPLRVRHKQRKYEIQSARIANLLTNYPVLVNYRKQGVSSAESKDPHISLDKISCSWSDNTGRQTLTDVSMNVTGSQLVFITGPVGSGKSSLLMAILGELPIHSGQMSSVFSIAYVSQVPWVFSGTIRENIVFGRSFDGKKYQKVLSACDLLKDMHSFAKDDLTQIGERGVSLSGGQRARVSLARALYSEADIYLLDDPLSALDARVGKYIFERCICGILSDHLRIITTHQLQYVNMADHVVALSEGSVVYQGTSAGPECESMLSKPMVTSDATCGSVQEGIGLKKRPSTGPSRDPGLEGSQKDLEEEEEDKMEGSVSWRLYWSYVRAGAPAILLIGFVLLLIVVQGELDCQHILKEFECCRRNVNEPVQRISRFLGNKL